MFMPEQLMFPYPGKPPTMEELAEKLNVPLESIDDQTRSLLSKLTSLISHYLDVWRADNVRREQREQDMTSLYSFRQHGEEAETDEQVIEWEHHYHPGAVNSLPGLNRRLFET